MYSFDGVELPFVSSAINPFASKIPTAETPGYAGGYAGKRLAASRTASVLGTIKAASFADLLAALSNFQALHDVETAKQLVLRDGWFYYALPDPVTPSDMEATNLHYQVDYKITDPYCYSATLQTVNLSASGNTTVTTGAQGGNRRAVPTISVVISTPGGVVTITNATTGETCYLYPTAAQTYTINCRRQTLDAGTMAEFGGVFLSLAVGANTISISASGGAVVASATCAFRDRGA